MLAKELGEQRQTLIKAEQEKFSPNDLEDYIDNNEIEEISDQDSIDKKKEKLRKRFQFRE